MTMLLPLIGMPAAHRRDPLPRRHTRTSRGESLLNFLNGTRVLQDCVIAGAIRETDGVSVSFYQPRRHGPLLQIDDSICCARRCGPPTHRGKSPVANRQGVDDGVSRIHRVDSAVDECQIHSRWWRHCGAAELHNTLRNAGSGHNRRHGSAGGNTEKSSTGQLWFFHTGEYTATGNNRRPKVSTSVTNRRSR